jgi:hypothetical protein
MRNFRRLPPVLRVASLLGLQFPLPLFTLLLISNRWFFPQSGVYASRVAVIALNLGLVGMTCAHVVQTYSARFRQPGSGPFPLEAWQSQVRAIVLPTALTICAIILAVIISPTSSAFEIVFPTSIAGAVVAFVFLLHEQQPESRGQARTPRPRQSG